MSDLVEKLSLLLEHMQLHSLSQSVVSLLKDILLSLRLRLEGLEEVVFVFLSVLVEYLVGKPKSLLVSCL